MLSGLIVSTMRPPAEAISCSAALFAASGCSVTSASVSGGEAETAPMPISRQPARAAAHIKTNERRATTACVTPAGRSTPAMRRPHAFVEDLLDLANPCRTERDVLALARHTSQDVLQLFEAGHRRAASLHTQLHLGIGEHDQARGRHVVVLQAAL